MGARKTHSHARILGRRQTHIRKQDDKIKRRRKYK